MCTTAVFVFAPCCAFHVRVRLSSQKKKRRVHWVYCFGDWLLKDHPTADDTHIYTHTNAPTEKRLKHLTLHLASSWAESFYWLSVFSLRPVQTNRLFVYELCLCYCVHLLQPGMAARTVCVSVIRACTTPFDYVSVYVYWQRESGFWFSSCANVKQRLN